MKFLKKLLHGIQLLFVLFCLLILLCAFYPGLTEKLSDILYADKSDTTAMMPSPEESETSASSETESIMPESTGLTAADLVSTVGELNSGADAYIVPQKSSLEIPQDVSSKTGYQPIQESKEEIAEDEAQIIQSRLSVGSTGDGLEFDSRFYPYYAMLDDTGKHLYRQIYANASDVNAAFSPIEEISAAQLKNVFTAVYNDHPDLFWLDTAYACKYLRSGSCVEIRLQFNRTAEDLEREKASFQAEAQKIIALAQNAGSNYDKERLVHDALLDQITYDLGAEMHQSAYSALVLGQTVCAGYARAFQYVMQQLGIPCYYCTGYAGENHAWNIIGLEDGFYNVDTTWDDTQPETYDYFNKSDSDFASTHMRQDMSVNLPPCNGKAYSNLEQQQQEANRRSLEDVGIQPEAVLTTLSEYFDNCYENMVQKGYGSYEFVNVIEGEALLQEWAAAYQYDEYRQGYMEEALKTLGASASLVEATVEELQGGYFYIVHKMKVE